MTGPIPDRAPDCANGSLRLLRQPGPADPVRIESLEGRGRRIEIDVRPGLSLVDAIAAPLLAAGLESASAVMNGGSLRPFTYVLPSVSRDPKYAAYYSEAHSPPGETRIEAANLTVGRRDGEPFVHCHAIWIEADGARRGGHIMPHETFVSASAVATAWGLADVAFRSEFDPETNFTLFHPVPASPQPLSDGPQLVAARIRPNEDICEALEAICRTHGFAAAVLRGSVGSVIDPVFEGRHAIHSDSTELLVRSGSVKPDQSGALRSELDISLVDTEGRLHEGRIARGCNPVCITFELIMEEFASV